MVETAYIRLTPDGYWGLFYGDGTEDEPYLLAAGRPFEAGLAIREAVEELEALARDYGYEVVVPLYGGGDVDLSELIEPEIYDDVFGHDADAGE
jgi:hypothetical protein